ncbi:hypothetical protein, partial [Trichloromonas sp.]|uniref:hypothetical protein n=1 Tax=Trichloromonas sp. TaxID=3069249 RepID=UPI002A44266F|nr:hypothetical protein [Trichloromonas sp.]
LAVQLTVPVIRVRRGLSPPSQRLTTTINHLVLTHHAPCLAHQVKRLPTQRPAAVLFFSKYLKSEV